MTNGLNWSQDHDTWRAEVDIPSPADTFYAPRGATYQIRKHGSPPLYELRWLWHPDFSDDSPESRAESERNYTESHWKNPHLTREFETLSDAMRDAEDMERYRLNPGRHALPRGELKGVQVHFECDYDGTRFAIIDEREADMTGWTMETIDPMLGTRHITQFRRDKPWGYSDSSKKFLTAGYYSGPYRHPWSAICDFGNTITRWIPPKPHTQASSDAGPGERETLSSDA